MRAILYILLFFYSLQAPAQTVITVNFFGTGSPQKTATFPGILAKRDVEYIDVQTRIRYRQTTLPQGTNWQQIATNALVNCDYLDCGTGTATWGDISGSLYNQTDLRDTLLKRITYSDTTNNIVTYYRLNYKIDSLAATFPSLTGYVQSTRLINTTAPLQGGGDLSANRTLSITQASASTDGYLSSADWITFNNKGSGTVTNISAGWGLTGGPITTTGTLTADSATLSTYYPRVRDSTIVFATAYQLSTYQPVAYLRSTTDQSTTSTTPVNITNGSFSIAANEIWSVNLLFRVGTSANNGMRMDVTVPSGCTIHLLQSGSNTATTNIGTQWLQTSATTALTLNSFTTTAGYIRIEGYVVNGATAGTFQVRFNTQNVTNTVTLYTNSGGIAKRIN